MFKKLKMKAAARRVEDKKTQTSGKRATGRKSPKQTFWARVWAIICAPVKFIARIIRRIWTWICNIDLIGLVNLTLLVAIIVLFTMLIIDIVRVRRTPNVVLIEKPAVAEVVQPTSVRPVRQTVPTLPIKRGQNREYVATPVSVTNVKPCQTAIRQTARVGRDLYGDIIIDHRDSATILRSGDTVRGNLYLQNMRKYTLPCGVRVEGNLFLRDVNMVQFCGAFTVTGNIYVSPKSSFGPLPRTARLGGQVIL